MRSQIGLNCLNFQTAAIQTGFGPYIAVWLTQNGWGLKTIGIALGVGTFAQLIAQVPGGYLVDHIHHKRRVAAAALIGLGVSAFLMTPAPTRTLVWGSQILHAVASALMTPALAALTLSVCGHAGFSKRLGVNASYASAGAALSAALLGFAATVVSERAVFQAICWMVPPALAALLLIHPAEFGDEEEEHPATRHPRKRQFPAWTTFREPALHVFAVASVLFQLANAALLPAALNGLTRRGEVNGYIVSATVIVPQVIVAILSPLAGAWAQKFGRRPVLLAGFAALPLRAVLFATLPSAVPLVLYQALDGVSAAVFGLMLPLIAADLTSRTGYLNLAIGSLGLAGGLGAMLSTTMAGVLADRFGEPAMFLALAGIGLLGMLLLALAMPETRPVRRRDAVKATLPA